MHPADLPLRCGLPDSGERYLSGPLCEGLFTESGLAS